MFKKILFLIIIIAGIYFSYNKWQSYKISQFLPESINNYEITYRGVGKNMIDQRLANIVYKPLNEEVKQSIELIDVAIIKEESPEKAKAEVGFRSDIYSDSWKVTSIDGVDVYTGFTSAEDLKTLEQKYQEMYAGWWEDDYMFKINIKGIKEKDDKEKMVKVMNEIVETTIKGYKSK